MLALILVVVLGTTVVLFSEEIIEMFKKIFAIPGLLLFIPLIMATFLFIYGELPILAVLLAIQKFLVKLISTIANSLPFGIFSTYIVSIFVIVILTCLPVFLLDLWLKKKKRNGFAYHYLTSTIIWIAICILFVLSPAA